MNDPPSLGLSLLQTAFKEMAVIVIVGQESWDRTEIRAGFATHQAGASCGDGWTPAILF